MEATFGSNTCSFFEKLLSCIDKITAPKKVREFPRHYHIISYSVVDGETSYLIYDFDKKSKYFIHPN
jgi:hypothetical protein